ncbi:MAG: recombinase family protein [Hungatella sp.]|jgi:hypothetical protein|nr:recombinase family protein [Hungatella sp.]
MARKSRKNIEAATPVVYEAPTYNTAGYIRLSVEDKRKKGDSIETQKSIVENFIALQADMKFHDFYIDNGTTGTTFDRPAFQKMLCDAESGVINCIVVKDLSRLGRNGIDTGYYIEKYLPLEMSEQELEDLLYGVIAKQAQTIMNTDSLGDMHRAEIRSEQQAEYERLIEKCRDRKQRLYEQFVLCEIDAATFKSEKAVADAELIRLTRALETLKTESAARTAAKAADNERRKLAQTALAESKLTRPLVEMLIDKVYVYPGNRVEIVWKVADFIKYDKEVLISA